jgi:hypothetical protein
VDSAIPPDVAKKLLNRNIANLVSRVTNGGKLSRAEVATLQVIASGAPNDATLARSYVELGEILGVTRQTLHTWNKIEGAPVANSNGTHDVNLWREFMRAKELKGGEALPTDDETRLKARKLLAEVEEREIKVQIKRKEWVRLEEVRSKWTQLVASATTLLRQKFEQELPPILSGLDAVGIQDEARRAIDEVLAILHGE